MPGKFGSSVNDIHALITFGMQWMVKMENKKLFSDKWMMIIGIPMVSLSFPFLFGLHFGSKDFFGWILISVFTTGTTWLVTRQITDIFWIRFPWETNPLLHIFLTMSMVFVYSMVTIGIVYALHQLFISPDPGYWQKTHSLRVGIFLINFFLVLLHETVLLFYKWKRELTRVADLEKENLRAKLDALKNHVHPHFLFNSLGTLASLVRTDPVKAEKYIGEFSQIYRYFLEVNNNDLVTLRDELNFIHSYVYLQEIRFGKGFSFHDKVDDVYHSFCILPLTLELLVENALKHNTTMVSSPLIIEVFVTGGDCLVLRNNYQPRDAGVTTGTGLANLEQRYRGFLGRPIHWSQEHSFFTAEIPLIQAQP